MAMATYIATDWHERAAKWQFVALHGKPTSSAHDRTKARRLDDSQWVGNCIDVRLCRREGDGTVGARVVGICPTGIACLKQIYYKQQPAVAVVWAISTWLGLASLLALATAPASAPAPATARAPTPATAPPLLAWPCTCRFVLSANLLRQCVCVCLE